MFHSSPSEDISLPQNTPSTRPDHANNKLMHQGIQFSPPSVSKSKHSSTRSSSLQPTIPNTDLIDILLQETKKQLLSSPLFNTTSKSVASSQSSTISSHILIEQQINDERTTARFLADNNLDTNSELYKQLYYSGLDLELQQDKQICNCFICSDGTSQSLPLSLQICPFASLYYLDNVPVDSNNLNDASMHNHNSGSNVSINKKFQERPEDQCSAAATSPIRQDTSMSITNNDDTGNTTNSDSNTKYESEKLYYWVDEDELCRYVPALQISSTGNNENTMVLRTRDVKRKQTLQTVLSRIHKQQKRHESSSPETAPINQMETPRSSSPPDKSPLTMQNNRKRSLETST